jgi:hypothetical protein
MGCDVTVYRLYKPVNNTDTLILAHAVWPAYPGDSFYWWASDILEERFKLLLIYASKNMDTKNAINIGQSYTCTNGDIFDQSCDKDFFRECNLDIWYSYSISDPKVFAFGIHSSEEEFWQELNDWKSDFGPYGKPALKANVLYLR